MNDINTEHEPYLAAVATAVQESDLGVQEWCADPDFPRNGVLILAAESTRHAHGNRLVHLR